MSRRLRWIAAIAIMNLVACRDTPSTSPLTADGGRARAATSAASAPVVYADSNAFEMAMGTLLARRTTFQVDDAGTSHTTGWGVDHPAGLTFSGIQLVPVSMYNGGWLPLPGAATNRFNVPEGTRAFGVSVFTYYGGATTLHVTLSTGQTFNLPVAMVQSQEFTGFITAQPFEWLSISFTGDAPFYIGAVAGIEPGLASGVRIFPDSGQFEAATGDFLKRRGTFATNDAGGSHMQGWAVHFADGLSFSGVRLVPATMYMGGYLPSPGAMTNRFEVPAGTRALGLWVTTYYGNPTTLRVTLSTGKVVNVPVGATGVPDFVGLVADEPFEWLTVTHTGGTPLYLGVVVGVDQEMLTGIRVYADSIPFESAMSGLLPRRTTFHVDDAGRSHATGWAIDHAQGLTFKGVRMVPATVFNGGYIPSPAIVTQRFEVPAGTRALGLWVMTYYGDPTTLRATLSTGKTVQIPVGTHGLPDFVGLIANEPFEWMTLTHVGGSPLYLGVVVGSAAGVAPVGALVSTAPADPTTGVPAPISLTFDNVTSAGGVTATSGTPGDATAPAPPSADFRLGDSQRAVYYDIVLSGSLAFTGTVRICIAYPAEQFASTQDLRLLHFENGAWVVLPDQSIDLETRTVCAQTTSFSPFMIAELNRAPQVTRVGVAVDPVPVNTATTLTAAFTDANLNDLHTGTFEWGSPPVSGSIVQHAGGGTLTLSRSFAAAGVYTVSASVSDGGQVGSRSSLLDVPAYLVVYDPSAGFVTGGGWILSPQGACASSLCATYTGAGKATFGFVARYHTGAQVPAGSTQFQFSAGGLDFESTRYDWLVVSGENRAQFKGEGVVKGRPGTFKFLLTAVDGGMNGADAFRIKLVDGNGTVVYDNRRDVVGDESATTALGGGSIRIHRN